MKVKPLDDYQKTVFRLRIWSYGPEKIINCSFGSLLLIAFNFWARNLSIFKMNESI